MSVDDSRLEDWQRKQERNRVDDDKRNDSPLHAGGGGGTSGGMNASWKDYVDARDSMVSSDLKAEMASLRADIAKLPTTWTLIATALAIVSVILAVLAFGGARFSGGLALADQRQEQLERDRRQDETVKQTNAKLDEILKRLPAK